MVWELARTVTIPVIGIGGIASAEDAVEFLLAGATAVQVGTASFLDPTAAKTIKDGLARYCSARGLAARDLIGKMK
jgi:dihydroorotate dehydrogenase (NAD+) catalytic subunit